MCDCLAARIPEKYDGLVNRFLRYFLSAEPGLDIPACAFATMSPPGDTTPFRKLTDGNFSGGTVFNFYRRSEIDDPAGQGLAPAPSQNQRAVEVIITFHDSSS